MFFYFFFMKNIYFILFFVFCYLVNLCISFSWSGEFLFLFYENFYMIFLTLTIFVLGSVCLSKMSILLKGLVLFSMFFFFSKTFLFFYLWLEMSIFPIVFMIFFYGLQPEKMKAFFYFFFYTVFSGYFFFFVIMNSFFSNILMVKEFSTLFMFFFCMNFMFKLPLFFFHFWLPLAHTEAPSLGSIVLAGLLLKLGGYGTLMFFYIFSSFFSFIFFLMSMFGFLISSIFCSIQSDGKVMIAYSSITHMNFGFFVLFFFSKISKVCNFLMMFTHGILASLMFWSFGLVYYMSFSRSIYFLKGFFFKTFFMMLTIYLSNFGLPPFLSFFQEIFFFFSIFIFSFYFFFFLLIFFVVMMYYNIFFCLVMMKKNSKKKLYVTESLLFFFFSVFTLNYFILNFFVFKINFDF